MGSPKYIIIFWGVGAENGRKTNALETKSATIEKGADARLDKGRRMSVLAVRDFAAPQSVNEADAPLSVVAYNGECNAHPIHRGAHNAARIPAYPHPSPQGYTIGCDRLR